MYVDTICWFTRAFILAIVHCVDSRVVSCRVWKCLRVCLAAAFRLLTPAPPRPRADFVGAYTSIAVACYVAVQGHEHSAGTWYLSSFEKKKEALQAARGFAPSELAALERRIRHLGLDLRGVE
jgi:hypothetical protein